MSDAEQPQAAHRDDLATPSESRGHAVSHLFREHNRLLVRYLTARLRSEQCSSRGELRFECAGRDYSALRASPYGSP
jgi:hypothetical protein